MQVSGSKQCIASTCKIFDNPPSMTLSECALDSVSSVCLAARVDVTASGQGQLSDNSYFFPPSCRWSTCSGFLHQLLDLDWHVGSDYIHGELSHQRLICTVIITKHSMRSP